MEAFLASRSSNFRSQYRSSCKKLERLGEVRLRYAGTDIPIANAIEVLARLHRERFEKESASFRSEAYVRFHTRLAESFFERGWLWLVVLELAGEPIAARYDYVYANKVWCMQGGWDPRLRCVPPGDDLDGCRNTMGHRAWTSGIRFSLRRRAVQGSLVERGTSDDERASVQSGHDGGANIAGRAGCEADSWGAVARWRGFEGRLDALHRREPYPPLSSQDRSFYASNILSMRTQYARPLLCVSDL